MNSKNSINISVITIFCLLFSIVQVLGQSQTSPGKIMGIVTDSNNAVVPNATIKLIDENSRAEEITTSNERGIYEFVPVKPGKYTISADGSGFAEQSKKVIVTDGQMLDINFSLDVGDVEAAVDIIVTAQKVRESAQKVPMTVTAVSAPQIQNLQIDNVNELGRITPNFQVHDDGGDLFPVFASRGIFTIEESPTFGIYVDEVPIFDTFGITSQLGNVEQIEVIKGSQGTLYGRGALAGVLKISTRKPSNKVEGLLKFGYGNLSQKDVNLYFQTPVSDSLFFGANVLYNKRDGYVENTFLDKKLLNNDVLVVGSTLRYFPKEKPFSFYLRTNFNKSQKDAYALIGGIGRDQTFFDNSLRDNAYKLSYNTQGDYNKTTFNNAFSFTYYANNFDLKTVTTYQYNDLDMKGEEFDWTEFDINSRNSDISKRIFSQEIRLNSSDTKPLQWLAGMFIHSIQRNVKSTLLYGKDLVARYASFPTDAAQLPYSSVGGNKISQIGVAGFTNVTYAISGNFKVNAGLRYEREFFDLDVKSYHEKDGRRFTYKGTLLNLENAAFDKKVKFGAFSYKGGFSYELNDSQILWASIGRGYRPGGVNDFAREESKVVFNPEHSLTYELGFKSTLLNQRLRANVTSFYTNYTDQQIFTVTDPASFAAAKLNLGNSSSYGLEMESSLLLNRNFSLNIGLGYLKSEIKEFKANVGFPAKEVDYRGKRQPYSPEWNSSAGLLYQASIGEKASLDAYVDYQYQTDIYFNFANTLSQPSYGLLNTRWDLSYTNYTISFWGKNLTNKVYYGYGYDILEVYSFMSYGRPRTFGANLAVRF